MKYQLKFYEEYKKNYNLNKYYYEKAKLEYALSEGSSSRLTSLYNTTKFYEDKMDLVKHFDFFNNLKIKEIETFELSNYVKNVKTDFVNNQIEYQFKDSVYHYDSKNNELTFDYKITFSLDDTNIEIVMQNGEKIILNKK